MSEILFKCRFKVPRHASKKNEKEPGISRNHIYIRQKAKSRYAEQRMLHSLFIEKLKQRIDQPIENDISIKFTFYFPETIYYTKKNQRSKKLPDLSNLYQLPEDVLQKAKIILNDTQIENHDGSRRLPISGTEYWLEIEIRNFISECML